MTLDDIARQLDEMQRDMRAMRSDVNGTSRDLTSLTQKVDEGFSASRARDKELRGLTATVGGLTTTVDDLTATVGGLTATVGGLTATVGGLTATVDDLTTTVDDLTRTVNEGFSASRARDEELRDLMKFRLEAREALRETVELRFDQTDRKFDEQIGLLKDVIRHNVSNQ